MQDVRPLVEWMRLRGLEADGLVTASGLEARVIEAIMAGRFTPSPRQRRRVAATLLLDPEQIAWGHAAVVEHMYGHGPQFGRSP